MSAIKLEVDDLCVRFTSGRKEVDAVRNVLSLIHI